MAILVILPAASATGGSFDLLGSREDCASSYASNSTSYSSGSSWGRRDDYAWSRECSGRSDAANASASDNVGPLANAHAGAWNGSSSESRYTHESSGYSGSYNDSNTTTTYSGYADRQEQSWRGSTSAERGAVVDSAAGSAAVADGCRNTWSDSGSSSGSSWSFASYPNTGPANNSTPPTQAPTPYNSYSYSQQHQEWSHAYEGQCGQTISGRAAGRDASAFQGSRCKYQNNASGDFQTSTWNGQSQSWQTSRSDASRTCRNGQTLDGEGESVFIGQESACKSSSYSSGNASSSHGYETERCFDGFVVEGPTGLRAQSGNTTDSERECGWNGTSSCRYDQYSDDAVAYSWTNGPLGPMGGDIVTAPSNPSPLLP